MNSLCKCTATVSLCPSGETCDVASGKCKCGNADSCYTTENPLETCVNNVCKCGSRDSCSGSSKAQAPYCDATNNICKCSASLKACTSPETCDGGKCKCGTADSCVDSAHAAYCDSAQNVCKCASSVAACSDLKLCVSGSCTGIKIFHLSKVYLFIIL